MGRGSKQAPVRVRRQWAADRAYGRRCVVRGDRSPRGLVDDRRRCRRVASIWSGQVHTEVFGDLFDCHSVAAITGDSNDVVTETL